MEAHSGQGDKAGRPYVDHLRRVAESNAVFGDYCQAASWLHDVVEDTTVTLDDLRAAKFPRGILIAIELLTRKSGEDPDQYYLRVLSQRLATQVKRADVADNSRPERLAALADRERSRLEAKYLHARRAHFGDWCHLQVADLAASDPAVVLIAWLEEQDAYNSPLWLYDFYPKVLADRSLSLSVAAAAAEPGITRAVLSACPEQADLYDLEWRLKSPGSLSRKLAKDLQSGKAVSEASPADVHRYTLLTTSSENLTEEAARMAASLGAHGWRVIEASQSYLEGNPYKGLHSSWSTPTGEVVELQFHSEASQAVKDATHHLYEEYRALATTIGRRRELWRARVAAWSEVSEPAGLEGLALGGVKVEPQRYSAPVELDL